MKNIKLIILIIIKIIHRFKYTVKKTSTTVVEDLLNYQVEWIFDRK